MIKNFSNEQLFLDQDVVKALGVSATEIEEAIVNEVKNYENVAEAYTGTAMRNQEFTKGLASNLQMGYNFNRSGDVLLVLSPGYIPSSSRTGTTHGSGYAYDTHTPLLFFGKGINHGETVKRTEIPDIANTICSLLGIAFPSGKSGEPIQEVIK